MLTQNTLQAGDNGNKLIIAWNDLALIALAVSTSDDNSLVNQLPFAGVGISPLPWTIGLDSHKLFVRDNNGKLICSKAITKTNISQLQNDFEKLLIALPKINTISFME